MSFDVAPDDYTRFMGRYSEPLGALFADAAGVSGGQRVLDVGCGPGALTSHLVARVGVDRVSAVDPSSSFVDGTRARFPGIDARQGVAEDLPYESDSFDVALAQLVVHFMTDADRGVAEMARVTRSGGTVGACVWDLGPNERGPISLLWRMVRELDPEAQDESQLAGVREDELVTLFTNAGLGDIDSSELTVRVAYTCFEEWWEPNTFGIGPAGIYVASLSPERRAALRERCAAELPDGRFELEATAWCAVGRS
ncbi:class I SAM-dependent methyltransferase [Nocardia sp. 348MFTsu5.1]|uniref:class I SAM-dependent methyltransferase n=1 Tax=Nocardia sp. 348MFTsu5.1 TaxID=1172185 RepID=UPI000379638B|nr:class I SAM-dependent methyltransferase [Nocardia sp. 348MFTsu5.1]